MQLFTIGKVFNRDDFRAVVLDRRDGFLDGELLAESFPGIATAFLVNVRLFLIAEVLTLVLGLLLAIMRSLGGPVFFPVRLLATVYVDAFRALPSVLVIS